MAEPKNLDDYMTSKEVCKTFGVCIKTLQRWREAGKLDGIRPGRRWLYLKADIKKLVDDMDGAR